MQVRVNKRLITNSDFQTQAARDLFFMLLAHPEGLTKEEIGVIFWPDDAPKEIKFRMKNTVYRVRHAVGKDVIILDQENYRFNNDLDYEYDVELFLKENALGLKAKDPLRKLAHFREAAKLYKGTFLPDIGETWVQCGARVTATNCHQYHAANAQKFIWTWLISTWRLNFASAPSPSTTAWN